MAHIVFTLEDGSELVADLNADLVTVGRHPESMVVLPSGSVSGQHATVKRRGESYFVQDLGTTNGTRVNGVEIEEVKLEHGDQISFGDVGGYFYATQEAAGAWDESTDEAPALESLPEPQAPVLAAQSEPSLFLPEKYSPVPRGPQPRKTGYVAVKPTRPVTRYKESSGCAGFLFFIGFLVFAFVVGLHVRHGQEHSGSILLIDVIEKLKADQMSEVDEATEAAPDGEPSTTPTPAPDAATSPAPAPAPAAPGSGSDAGAPGMGGGMMGGGEGKEPSM